MSNIIKENEIEINDGHYLELMDRLHIVNCTIDEHILNHPLAEVNKDIQQKIDEALSLLLDAYQMIGNKIPN
jgi:hypothetical protein